jgi:hypothetical protein
MGEQRDCKCEIKNVSITANQEFELADYSVVVKRHVQLAGRWRWEIHRAGRKTPINRSADQFATIGAANRAGREALQALLKTLRLA